MSTKLPDDGATIVPQEPLKMECPGDGSGITMAHKWAWLKDSGFNKVQCARCGKVEERLKK